MTNSILIVEDNPENRRLIILFLKRLLQREIEVHEADDGDVGCAKAREVRPDLILMDIQMPRMDGITAMRELKNDPATRDIPVIVLSANLNDVEIARAQEAGALAIIPKPLELGTFISVVKTHLP
jgi:CheY-like chemotaxis protein